MNYLEKIIELTDDERVTLGQSMKELLNKELCLGMTRYVCRYGTLSDGFEKITPAQRYYQAIREMYYKSSSIRSDKAQAMNAEADLMDAQEELEAAQKPSERLRAEANVLLCQERLVSLLVKVEDDIRQLDEFTKVYKELQDEVRAKYPNGVEQSEPDNWRAVAEYRFLKSKTNDLSKADMAAVPLPMEEKAELGVRYQRADMMAPMIINDESRMRQIVNGIDEENKKVTSLRGL